MSGELREAVIFGAVLGASSYLYAEASWVQDVESSVNSHVRAFEYFGGVVAMLVPYNLKSGVAKACHYEPVLSGKPFQKRPESRRQLFEELGRPTLRPLPALRYEYAE